MIRPLHLLLSAPLIGALSFAAPGEALEIIKMEKAAQFLQENRVEAYTGLRRYRMPCFTPTCKKAEKALYKLLEMEATNPDTDFFVVEYEVYEKSHPPTLLMGGKFYRPMKKSDGPSVRP